jgi:D-3-phosphoglycerate dehydrogenase
MSTRSKQNRVLVVDPIHDEAVKLLKDRGFLVDTQLFPDPKSLTLLLKDYDVLICRTNTKLNKQFFDEANNIQCVALASTGYDQIDLESATKNNTAVIGLPSENKEIDTKKHGNFVSTAEHTILLILAALGNFYEASNSMKEGKWDKPNFVGVEAYNKKLGLIGFGRIGKLVATRAHAFGMETIAYDPYVSMEEISDCGTTKVSLETLCEESDIISIHAPKTPETIGLLNEKMFDLMKTGVTIVNAARSEIIDKESLIKALDSNKVNRVALDVFNNEPHDIEWDLVKHKKVIPTPHIGGSTKEALQRISISTAHSLINFMINGDQANLINKK